MSWIEKFSKGMSGLVMGNTLGAFQPLDFNHFNPLWYDLLVDKIAEALKKLDVDNQEFSKIQPLLPCPSSIRAVLGKMIPAWSHVPVKNAKNYRWAANFLANSLLKMCPDDPFAEKSNPCHEDREINKIVNNLKWEKSDIEKAKQLGRLNAVAGSLVHGLYNDVVTDMSWDVYGPYQINFKGKEYSMLIRHFVNLAPHELWPKKFLALVKEIKIYALYQDIDWEINAVGCHTIAKSGNPIEGLKRCVVLVDGHQAQGNELDDLIDKLAVKAEDLYKEIRKMSLEEIKEKVLLQECYQLKKIFDAAGIDWRPTEEMLARVRNKPLLKDIYPLDKLITSVEEFDEIFEVERFVKEVLESK